MYDVSFTWFSIVVLVCCQVVLAVENEWSVNVNCRDNSHNPVDWWAVYKPPPSQSAAGHGRNFTYLTPYSEGRWEPSDVPINQDSMLMNTIAPMFTDKIIQKNIAILKYTERPGEKGSAVMGVLLADEEGGIWVTHTVPGFPDLSKATPSFPGIEEKKGHMMTCMTLDHAALDGIVKVISLANPLIEKVQVPPHMAELLPSWTMAHVPGNTKVVDFVTRQKKLNPLMVVRKPGDKHCLLEVFAKAKKVVLDIYGDRNMHESFCYEDYGVRQIKSISLKLVGEVHYIDNSTDRATFGVSTAAHWQKTGAGPTQYWTCISSYEEPSVYPRGSMILCILNYDVWVAFGNLRVKEPSC